MEADPCIHELPAGQCSIRVALPTGRFGEEIERAVAALRAERQPVNVSAVQRVMRASGYESGRRPTTAAMKERGQLG